MARKRCQYLSGDGLSGEKDEDRCQEWASVSLLFAAQTDGRHNYYCAPHGEITVTAFECSSVEGMVV